MDILSKAKDIIVEYDNITEEMIHPDNVLNQEKMTSLSKKRSSIEKSYELSKQFVVLNRELSDLDEISDEKIRNFASNQTESILPKLSFK